MFLNILDVLKFGMGGKIEKQIIFIFIAFSLFNCKGQTEEGVQYPKEKIMTTDRFDIEKFKNYPKVLKLGEEKKLPSTKDTLPDGTVINYSWGKGLDKQKYYAKKTIPPVPALSYIEKEYYENGILKREKEVFLGQSINSDQIKFGISKYYDETGQLIKTVDESVKYDKIKVKPSNLLEILKREPLFVSFTKEERKHFIEIFQLNKKEDEVSPDIVNKALKKYFILDPDSRPDVENVFLKLSEDEKSWNVIKDIYPFGLIELNIDANSGKIISRTYAEETRP